MKILRIVSIIGALALMFGEVYRSWGTGRPLPFILDDMLAGMMMLWAVHLTRRPSMTGRRFLSAAWGVAAGMLYGSFFGKLVDPAGSVPGNFSIGILAALVGFAFLISLVGLAASIMIADERAGN